MGGGWGPSSNSVCLHVLTFPAWFLFLFCVVFMLVLCSLNCPACLVFVVRFVISPCSSCLVFLLVHLCLFGNVCAFFVVSLLCATPDFLIVFLLILLCFPFVLPCLLRVLVLLAYSVRLSVHSLSLCARLALSVFLSSLFAFLLCVSLFLFLSLSLSRSGLRPPPTAGGIPRAHVGSGV